MKQKNSIKQITVNSNKILYRAEEIEGAFKDYFDKLFSSTHPSTEDIESCLFSVEAKVTDDMNNTLGQEFTREEIQAALKQIAPLKSLGPNGFGACFFQSHWNIVGDED